MRRFRVFLFALLSLAVPLQGYAHIALPEVYCPMERMAMADVEAVHDCCIDEASADHAGKTCKSGQPCQSSGHFLMVSGLDVMPRSVATTHFPYLADTIPSFDPAATWRPPTPF